jgi:hypothetical protein
VQIPKRIGIAPNPSGRADGNRKQRVSRSLTAKRVGRQGESKLFSRSTLKLLLTLYVWSAGELAWACSCGGGLFFDEQVKRSSFLLLGRVRAQGRQEIRMSTQPQSGVAYLDVEVRESFKGKPPKGVVRIWDSNFGTGCEVGLDALPSGTLAVFSIEENRDPNSLPELWEITGIKPDAEDYLFGTCSEYWKVFKTERGARRHVRRLLH